MKLKVGLIGLGRLGRVYARDLSSRLAETELTAVADTNADLARGIASEFEVPRSYGHPEDLLADPNVDGVVIVSPTHTHKDVVIAAMKAHKPTFCEKPLALTLDECRAMDTAVTTSGTFFQMGFMRRFDPGYAAAKKQIDEGRVGRPVVFKSTSRDPLQTEPRVCEPGEQRRHPRRYGDSRFRPRPMVHGRSQERHRDRRSARLPGDGLGGRHRQRHRHAGLQ